MTKPLFFSAIDVTRQAFYRNPLSFAIVNIKPIVPGHVLVVPNRQVPRLFELDDLELASLTQSVKHVGSVIESVYNADSLTIVCQDGKSAGQTVPHVHFHILPRKSDDPFAAHNDAIYPALDRNEESMQSDLTRGNAKPLKVDDNRSPRMMEEMEKEAIWLRTFFE